MKSIAVIGYPLSKVVVCCIFINHLPDQLVAKYGASDRAKIAQSARLFMIIAQFSERQSPP